MNEVPSLVHEEVVSRSGLRNVEELKTLLVGRRWTKLASPSHDPNCSFSKVIVISVCGPQETALGVYLQQSVKLGVFMDRQLGGDVALVLAVHHQRFGS